MTLYLKEGDCIHSYYRAIGFAKNFSKQIIRSIIDKAIKEYKEKLDKITVGKLTEIFVQFDNSMGLVIHGEFLESGEFEVEYNYPYVKPKNFEYYEDISIEKNISNCSFSAAYEYAPGSIYIIFYLQNTLDCINHNVPSKISTEVGLAALSTYGKIILPGNENLENNQEYELYKIDKKKLIADAKNGDEEAIESLTFDEMDMYSKISKRVLTEDILTIVNTSFIPYGYECDRYEVIGNIIFLEEHVNKITNERLYNLTIECNNIMFNVMINKFDLLGIPEVGRRFKGNIWLQGNINFQDA